MAGCSAAWETDPNGRRFSHRRRRGHERQGKAQERADLSLETTLRAGDVPGKRGLARRRDGRWIHRQLQVPEDFLDDRVNRTKGGEVS